MASKPEKVKVDEVVLLRSAVADAAHLLDCNHLLPRYLREALLKFQKAQAKRRTTELLLPNLVERHAAYGAPKGNVSPSESAYSLAGKDVGVSASTAQRAHRDFPPEGEDE